jgi:hypothetical protein
MNFVIASLIANIITGPPAPDPARDLDFWVGSWTMDSSQPSDPKTKGAWQKKYCTNRVTKVYGGKVVQESFRSPGFTGGSWSSYDAVGKKWRQTWVDDSGAYLLFEGGMIGDEFVLNQTNTAKGHARMRFVKITKSGFDWLWEHSKNGEEWILDWHLRYHRVGKGS